MLKVTKRDGTLEQLDVEQIHKMVNFACEGLDDVSMSAVVMGAQIEFIDGMHTSDIQNLLVKSAHQLITLEEPNYQYVAARLLLFGLYKSLYPKWAKIGFPDLFTHLSNYNDVYDFDYLNERYSFEEFCYFSENVIDHSRDYNFTYSGIQQLCDKYLVQNRSTGQIYETPQYMYMLVSMTIFADYPKNIRIQKVTDCYNTISTWKVNLPTPVLCSVRTNNKGAASCCLIDVADSIDGIAIANAQILKATASNMGLGINMSRIRNIGSPVRNGEVLHTGVIPILKTIEANVKACTQSSRGGCFVPGSKVYIVEKIKLNEHITNPNDMITYHNNIDLSYEHYNRELCTFGLDTLFIKSVDIEDVKVGQYVLSWDTEIERYQVNKVLTLWTPKIPVEEQLSIYLYNGIILNTTNSHKMWVYPQSREDCGCWLRSDEIRSGDSLMSVDMTLHKINYTSPEPSGFKKYYDLEVENSHCYFVGDGEDYRDKNLYLSHNSATVFVNIWNLEIENIIQLKNNKGTSENRIKNLDYAIIMSRLFYQRFLDNKDISLFSSSEVPGLVDAYGTSAFDEMYEYYEASDVRRKTVNMNKLFLDIVHERSETCRLYILNIEHANTHSPFLDTVYQSNLCLHGDARILTSNGYQRISDLQDTEATVWNGIDWSDTVVRKTGENKKMVYVKTQSGNSVICTPYHKFYITNTSGIPGLPILEKRANELEYGDILVNYELPSGIISNNIYEKNYNETIQSVDEIDGLFDSYCCTEPVYGTIIVNGILTGQCMEILQPSRPIEKYIDLV